MEKKVDKIEAGNLCTCRATDFTTTGYCTNCGLELPKKEKELMQEEADKIITMEIRNFNPKDNRIDILIQGFIKKAKELGFHDDNHTYDTVLGQQEDYKNRRFSWNFESC